MIRLARSKRQVEVGPQTRPRRGLKGRRCTRSEIPHRVAAGVVFAWVWIQGCGGEPGAARSLREHAETGPPVEGMLVRRVHGRPTADSESAGRRREGFDANRGALRRDGSDEVDAASAAGLHALLRGRHGKAVASLRAAALSGDDWRDWNDLAVALGERARVEDRRLDQVRALSAALRAARLAPDEPEVTFNLALTLSKLHLHRSARVAWARFLTLEPAFLGTEDPYEVARTYLASLSRAARRERWDEAASGLDEIELPDETWRIDALVRDFADLVRTHAERRLTAQWSAAVLAGDFASADQASEIGRAIGGSLSAQRGEHSIADLFDFVDRCRERADNGVACARSIVEYVEGVDAFNAGDLATAEHLLASAAAGLREVSSPLHRWADYYLVYATFHRDVPASLEGLTKQLTPHVESRYPSLAGRIHWRIGVAAASLGSSQDARDHYLRGQQLLSNAGGPEEASFAHALLAEAYDLIGDTARAWWHRLELFGVAAYSGDPRAVHSMLATSARALLSEGETESALAFLDELVDHAVEIDQPEYLAEAYRDRGELLARTGDAVAALHDLERARALALELGDSARREHLLATIALTEGVAWMRTNPVGAVERFTGALSDFDHARNGFYRQRSLGLRAAVLKRLGDLHSALEDRREEIRLLEFQRESVRDRSRLGALAPAQEAYDAAVEILVELDRPLEALSLAERGRGRYLLDLLGEAAGTAASPLPAAEIQRRLPGDTALVQYAVLDHEVVTWVLDLAGLRQVRFPIAARRLESLVAALASEFEASAGETRVQAVSAELHRILIAPLDLDYRTVDRIVFIPDRQLFRVPFAALFDPRTARFLVEDIAVSIAPSASLFLAATPRGRFGDGPALVVANPDLEDTPYDGLPRLPGALAEARAVASLYPGAAVLEGGDATASSVLAAMSGARLLHFAGHALANGDRALRSELLLAPSVEHGGAVSFEELVQRRVLAIPIVVLSACGTADGFTVDREGPLGLAAAFMATGSSAVLATLWRVDDQGSPALLYDFHSGLVAGQRPSDAWRRAVVKRLGERDGSAQSLATWAAFTLFETVREARIDGREE